MRTRRTVETKINHSLLYRIFLALPLPNLGRPRSKHTAISNISCRLENAMENVSFKVIGKVERNHLFSNLEKASGKGHFPTSFHSHWKQ
jgi:hypothetical protein